MVEQEEQQIPQDELDQEQQDLDKEQSATEASYVTTEQFEQLTRQIISAQTLQSRQIQGLHSGWARGLDAIRADTKRQYDTQVAQGIAQEREGILSGLEPEQQQVVRQQFAREDARRDIEAPPMEEQEQPESAPNSDLEAAYELVEGLGVARNDPKVNYAVLARTDLTPAQIRTEFTRSVKEAMTGAQQPPQRTEPQRRAPQSPPVEASSAPTGSYRGIDDIRDAYIAGTLPLDRAQEAASRLGAAL